MDGIFGLRKEKGKKERGGWPNEDWGFGFRPFFCRPLGALYFLKHPVNPAKS